MPNAENQGGRTPRRRGRSGRRRNGGGRPDGHGREPGGIEVMTARRASRGTHARPVALLRDRSPAGVRPDEGRDLRGLPTARATRAKAALERQEKAGERTYRWADRWHDWAQYYGDYDVHQARHGRGTRQGDVRAGERADDAAREECRPTSNNEHSGSCSTATGSPYTVRRGSAGERRPGGAGPAERARRQRCAKRWRACTRPGRTKGQSILRQLASGDMSLNEFIKRTVD